MHAERAVGEAMDESPPEAHHVRGQRRSEEDARGTEPEGGESKETARQPVAHRPDEKEAHWHTGQRQEKKAPTERRPANG